MKGNNMVKANNKPAPQMSAEFTRLEDWLKVLTSTYSEYPSCSLAKVILYYVGRLMKHEDIMQARDKRCDYFCMHKHWLWLIENTDYRE
ncbi:hypothetical protein SG34_005295 [Thalassomonas viridans]|uniref:Uncharacterized protein n=1 Tax=Thalassomonas viridans TaxID=137584 RepID=A0AAE9Z6U7_9GAMM|nr:hypothetical protein [Thalassomonas viridans]WDE06338.1 hypothetical protein SG34_005295 [Thalassomonas viridans]